MGTHLEMTKASLWEEEVGKSGLVSVPGAVIKYLGKGILRRKVFWSGVPSLWWGADSRQQEVWHPCLRGQGWLLLFLIGTDRSGSHRDPRPPPVGQPSHPHWDTQGSPAACLLADSKHDFTLDNFCFIFYGSDSSDQNMDDKNNASGRTESISHLVTDRAGWRRGMSWPVLFSQSAHQFLLLGLLIICHPVPSPAEIEECGKLSWKTDYCYFFLLPWVKSDSQLITDLVNRSPHIPLAW